MIRTFTLEVVKYKDVPSLLATFMKLRAIHRAGIPLDLNFDPVIGKLTTTATGFSENDIVITYTWELDPEPETAFFTFNEHPNE